MVRVRPGFPSLQLQGISGERLDGANVSRRLIPESAESAHRLLEEFLEYDRRGRFVGEYMVKVDGATMYYALEARAPFLDADLCEFARSLPYDLRLRHGQLKAVLRELARREIGERVAQGRKRGFGIPAERWMLDRWRSNVDEAFENSKLAEAGVAPSRRTFASVATCQEFRFREPPTLVPLCVGTVVPRGSGFLQEPHVSRRHGATVQRSMTDDYLHKLTGHA